jgi:hypothetical protein
MFILLKAKIVAFKTDSFSIEHLKQISICINEFFRFVCSLNDANQRIPRVVLSTFDSFAVVRFHYLLILNFDWFYLLNPYV